MQLPPVTNRMALERTEATMEVHSNGRVALVTGAASGLGRATVEAFACAGYQVAALDLDESRILDGDGIHSFACDVSDASAVERTVGQAMERFGRIDVAVNCAGVDFTYWLDEMTVEQFDRVIGVNLRGPFLIAKAVWPAMKRQGGGHIVNVASTAAVRAWAGASAYHASKFGLLGLGRGLGVEGRRDGIKVTTVVPGEMRTGSYRQALFGGNREAEFRWFAIGASLPTTISADRAARHIIRATKRRQAEVIFPWTMSLAARAHGVAPGVTARTLEVVNRLMPSADGRGRHIERGAEIEQRLRNPLWDAVTVAGRHAADHLNETPSPTASADAVQPPDPVMSQSEPPSPS